MERSKELSRQLKNYDNSFLEDRLLQNISKMKAKILNRISEETRRSLELKRRSLTI